MHFNLFMRRLIATKAVGGPRLPGWAFVEIIGAGAFMCLGDELGRLGASR